MSNLVITISEIWDALRAAAEADLSLAQAIVDSAGVIVTSADMTMCYDERGMCILYFCFLRFYEEITPTKPFFSAGAKYELPKYVLSEPTNLIQDN